MIKIDGKYCKDVKIFTDNVEEEAIGQIQSIANNKAFEGQKIRIMPDVHAGKGITIGFCSTLGDYVNPCHVGVDIGCMMSTVEYDKPIPVDKYEDFNHKVLTRIGFGHDVSPIKAYSDRDLYDYLTASCRRAKSAHPGLFYSLPDKVDQAWITGLCKRLRIGEKVFYASINSAGSGNHFIEYGEGVDSDGNPRYAVTVHCGSRNFGLRVCNYWEGMANAGLPKKEQKELTKEYKEHYLDTHDSMENFGQDLKAYLNTKKPCSIDGYLEGEMMHGYLSDMVIAVAYAEFNHKVIHDTIDKIVAVYGLRPVDYYDTKHNYIDFNCPVPIIRKGAIRSYDGERMIVPFNMRDGIAICEGKSNEDWLCSCSHGAGRKMSRTKAKDTLSLDEFKDTMKGVYSTTVDEFTLDEAPMAYKDTEEIKELIKDTCDVRYMLIPKINIKSNK